MPLSTTQRPHHPTGGCNRVAGAVLIACSGTLSNGEFRVRVGGRRNTCKRSEEKPRVLRLDATLADRAETVVFAGFRLTPAAN